MRWNPLDYLDIIGKGTAGLAGGIYKMTDPDADPEDKLGYSNPISGLIHGISNDKAMRMAETSRFLKGKYEDDRGGLERARDWIGNIAADPTNYLGLGVAPAKNALTAAKGVEKLAPLVGALEESSLLKNVAKGATTMDRLPIRNTPIAESLATHLGQLGRRTMTGASVTPGNSLLYGGLIGPIVEPLAARGAKAAAASNLVAGIGSKLGGVGLKEAVQEAPEVVGETLGRRTRAATNAVESVATPEAPLPSVSDTDFVRGMTEIPENAEFAAALERMMTPSTPKASAAPSILEDPDIARFAGSAAGEAKYTTLEQMMQDPRVAHVFGAARRSMALKMLKALQEGSL